MDSEGIKGKLDDKLGALDALVRKKGTDPFDSPTYEALKEEIEELLRRYASTLDEGSPASAEQYRILDEEFGHLKRKMEKKIQEENLRRLLGSGRDGGDRFGVTKEAEALLEERTSMSNSVLMANELLEISGNALESEAEFKQRLKGVSGKLIKIGEKAPGIEKIIRQIKVKEVRDSIIVGYVISVCIWIILWFAF